jgi:hypothetical protein
MTNMFSSKTACRNWRRSNQKGKKKGHSPSYFLCLFYGVVSISDWVEWLMHCKGFWKKKQSWPNRCNITDLIYKMKKITKSLQRYCISGDNRTCKLLNNTSAASPLHQPAGLFLITLYLKSLSVVSLIIIVEFTGKLEDALFLVEERVIICPPVGAY